MLVMEKKPVRRGTEGSYGTDGAAITRAGCGSGRKRQSPAPRLSGTPRRRTVSAGGVHDGGGDDGCGGSWPRRTDVAATQAGRGAASAAGRGPRDGVARAGRHRGHADGLAGRVPGRWRGEPGHPSRRRRGARKRTPQGEARRDAAEAGTARSQDRRPGGGPPFGPAEAEAMSRAVSPSGGKPYGLARVCRVWRAARSAVYRHRAPPRAVPPRRPGPIGAMPDAALLEAIRDVLAASPFHGEGHRKVWARLRFAGVRTSRRRVLRLMGEHGLLAPSRTGSPRGPRAHDGTIIPDAVDVMWGADLTTTWTGEGMASVFIAVDHCSAGCVGIHAARHATRFEALEPIQQGVRRHFGGFAQGIARGLALRHDHGSQYMSDAFQQEIAFLGIASSPAFVRAPEGNGCAERFIRTLKENLLWVRSFDTVEELRQVLLDFREVYNTTWLIERHGFQTPAAVRQNQLSLAARAA